MPKIFEYFGFIFYFYSNEQEPIHVHVQHSGKESVFELIMMDGNKDKHTASEFIEKYHKNIIDKWVKFFIMKKAVRSTNITKKI